MVERLPAGVALDEGEIYEDGWTSQRLVFRVHLNAEGNGILRLRGWNPSCAAKYFVNRVVLKSGHGTDAQDALFGRVFELAVPVRGSAEEDVETCTFTSEAAMAPDDLDRRERGIVLMEINHDSA